MVRSKRAAMWHLFSLLGAMDRNFHVVVHVANKIIIIIGSLKI